MTLCGAEQYDQYEIFEIDYHYKNVFFLHFFFLLLRFAFILITDY